MNVLNFRRLVQAVLLSAGPGATVACSDSNATEMPERAQCIDARGPNRYGALTLSSGVDGVAFATRGVVQSKTEPGEAAPPVPPAERIASLGAPCSTASDRGACERRIDEVLGSPSSAAWDLVLRDESSYSVWLADLGVITSGDDVQLATFDDVLRAAAPFETRDEAAAALVLQGFKLDCDGNNARRDGAGWTFKKTSSNCNGSVWERFSTVDVATGAVASSGTIQLKEADNNCVEGRRPANLAPTALRWLASLSACFSEIAHMEAAAVLALDELDARLRAVGAPPELLARAARAREDEVVHAAVTAELARRFGGSAPTPRVTAADDGGSTTTPLLRLALENAAEGCVREAYGALVAAFQAAHAADAGVREAFAKIAADEAEHAELSFAIDAWLCARLTADERRSVEAAKANAWRGLAAACAVEPAPEVASVAGMPTPAEARMLLAQLVRASLAGPDAAAA